MKRTEDEESSPLDGQEPCEVEFCVIDVDFGCGELLNPRKTGTLIYRDSIEMGLLTLTPLQPGNIFKFNHEGMSKLGIVMWSVESSNSYRIQLRFV
jgi:hypothetical protein